jgi:hypothetical protein
VRRLFWLSLGAAAGYYAAKKVPQVVEETRERGLVGNVSLAATTASKVAATAGRTASAVSGNVASRARTVTDPGTTGKGSTTGTDPTPTTREVGP